MNELLKIKLMSALSYNSPVQVSLIGGQMLYGKVINFSDQLNCIKLQEGTGWKHLIDLDYVAGISYKDEIVKNDELE